MISTSHSTVRSIRSATSSATLFATPSHVAHCNPVSVVSGMVSRSCASPAERAGLSAGDEIAHGLGIHPDRARIGFLLVVSLCTAAAVAGSTRR